MVEQPPDLHADHSTHVVDCPWCKLNDDWAKRDRFDDGLPESMREGLAEFQKSMHWDINSEPVSFGRWAELSEAKHSNGFGRVAETTVAGLWVSTVWLGINHAFFGGPPMIFETMVFDTDGGATDLGDWMHRYSTYEQALAGHDQVVADVRAAMHVPDSAPAEGAGGK